MLCYAIVNLLPLAEAHLPRLGYAYMHIHSFQWFFEHFTNSNCQVNTFGTMLTRLSFALHPSPAFTCQLHRIDVSFVPRAESSGRTAHDEYSYNSGSNDERRKATIEHIYRDTDGVAKNSSSSSVPWSMGWQMNERNTVWNDDLKLRLLKVRYC